jgi:hypothetical protein
MVSFLPKLGGLIARPSLGKRTPICMLGNMPRALGNGRPIWLLRCRGDEVVMTCGENKEAWNGMADTVIAGLRRGHAEEPNAVLYGQKK